MPTTSQTAPPLLAAGAERLAARHRGRFAIETIQALIADSHARLAATATVTTHLTVLAERLAGERLDALAHLDKPAPTGVPRVLFVCSANTGRSQMAAALLQQRADGALAVASAGTAPTGEGVEPAVTQVLAEAGIHLAGAYPKPLTPEVVAAADAVITLGCGDACPLVPGRHYLDWPIRDPHGLTLEAVRAIRDEIDTRVTDLLATLTH